MNARTFATTDSFDAYFIRCGIGKEWTRKGSTGIVFVFAIPIAQINESRIIYKYISDLLVYPWNYGRAQLQLRAWARLLTFRPGFCCEAVEMSFEISEQLLSKSMFIGEVIENHIHPTKDDWNPEDYACSAEESLVAKATESLPQVIEYLQSHNLPWKKPDLSQRFPRGSV